MKRNILSSIVGASLALTPLAAQAGDGFAGGLIGGVIGGIIASEANKSRNQPRPAYKPSSSSSRSSQPSAQRIANRDMQTALNYFGYNVGTPDGSVGPKTRAAVAQYQAFMGYAPTGQATDFERSILVTAHQRAMAGDPILMRVAATHAQGVRGMLLQQRDDLTKGTGAAPVMAGSFGGLPPEVSESLMEISRNSNVEPDQLLQRHGFVQLADINSDGRTDYILDTSVTGSAFWCNATACTVRVFASTPSGFQRNDFQAFNVTPATFSCQQGLCSKTDGGAAPPVMAVAPSPVAPQGGTVMAAAPVASAQPIVQAPASAVMAAAAPSLPTFGQPTEQVASLAAQCNKVAILTTSAGYTRLETMTNPASALMEQFCLARSYAMANGDDMIAKVSGATPALVAEQCATLAPSMKDHVAGLSLQPRDVVLKGVSDFVLASGMAPEQLATTARICLGSGYATDATGVALASALLLSVLGEKSYAELVGHHLATGIGATRRPDLALEWFETALGNDGGQAATQLVADVADRAALIRKAAYALAGKAEAVFTAPSATTSVAMPMFQMPAAPQN